MGNFAEESFRIASSRPGWDDTHIIAQRSIRAPKLSSFRPVYSKDSNFRISDHVMIRREDFGCIIQNKLHYTIRAFNNPVYEYLMSLEGGSQSFSGAIESKADSDILNLLVSEGTLVDATTPNTATRELYSFDAISNKLTAPLAVDLEITLKCGRLCTYCAYDSGPNAPSAGELPGDFWIDLMKEARSRGVVSIEFTGGDPLLHPDGMEVLTAADALGFFYTINSDLTRLSDEAIERLSALSNLIAVQTTIDGPNPEHNDRYRGKGSFKYLEQGVDRLSRFGIPVHAGMVVSAYNHNLVDQTAERARAMGIERLFVGSLYLAGRANGLDRMAMPTNEQLGVASRAYAMGVVEGRIIPVHPSFYELVPSFLENPTTFNHLLDNPDMINVGLYISEWIRGVKFLRALSLRGRNYSMLAT